MEQQNMIEENVHFLEGKALDWAVAKADDILDCIVITKGSKTLWLDHEIYQPSINWSQGGPLIEQHCIEILYGGSTVMAKLYGERNAAGSGSTPLLAACRALVTHKFGDNIQVPADLINR